ncbi:MAG: SDR family oxidoreductase [Proteobacteria bacterium]|nr:SDR family oxidoreductase [Pseudomonadota bacterium]
MPRAALVTGAATRIGRAITRMLAADGWAVAIHYRTSGKAAGALADEVARLGSLAVILAADLADEEATATLLARAAERIGPLGCLVNNASLFERDEVDTVTRESWDRHLQINLRSPFLLTQRFAAQLPRRASGAVVNLLDERVWNLTPHFVSYTVSKAGLWTLTRTMALALAPRVRVNAVGPGPTLPSRRQTRAQFARQCRLMPLGRGTTPEEVADAVRFLLSAPAMTGQMIALDGGQHLAWSQTHDRTAPDE